MTILVDALVVGGGILLGQWIARTIRARRRTSGGAPAANQRGGVQATADPFAGMPCKLGDVVVRTAERDEAWLAGALVFEEDKPVAALFVAPEAGGDRALFVRDAPGSGLTWLVPLPKGALPLTTDPPHAVEHEGARYERARRLPVKVTRVGTGAPAVGARAVVAEYAGAAAERLLVVAGTDQTLAWKGVSLSEGEYDVLPGGANTLER
ncbi:MAG TPA: hypothetical protein VF765_09025 [Polyangiaceae bacterium]